MNKTILFFCLFSIATTYVQAQDMDQTVNTLSTHSLQDTTQGWKHSGIAGITFGQTSLSNWVAGGDNTVSGNFVLNATANYLKNKWFWDNNLLMEYGMIHSTAYDWQKATDRINFKTVGGRGFNNNHKLSIAGLLNFSTQFAKGYNYPDTEHYISTWMAPGYFDAALGLTYKPNVHFSLFVSPLAERAIIVLNDSLSALGAFGVDAGKKVKWAMGAYLSAGYNQTVGENFSIITTLDLFTPYDKNFGKIDTNWNLLLNYKISKLITATLNTTLRHYDAEIQKVQFKEIFGLGLTYTF